uniref:Receptor-like serine/threonine-protein kinase n=1 Tax=Cucumis sativus TaxID=3659 RepID=A0A0A0L0L8_CUCSA
MALKITSSYFLFPPFLHSLLLLFILLVLPTCSFSQLFKNVTLGSSLTATQLNDHHNYWVSQSGDFAFGFLPLGTNTFLLAIWFDRIDEKTVLWSANRDNLVPKGSTFQFTNGGQLVLNDPGGNQIWTATVSSSGNSNRSVSYAAMLDSGNFVLAAADSEILWQSFDVPTDTILPSQTLNMGGTLVARYSESTYKSGRFQLVMQTDGNLVIYPRAFPLDKASNAYWASNTMGSGFQLVFNLSGSVDVIANNNTVLSTVLSTTLSPRNFYLRAILEHNGIFGLYAYPKPTHSSSMPRAWSQVSDSINICILVQTGWGSGVCGFNSYCRLGDDQRPFCSCPPGYILLDPNDEIKGCIPNFVAQSCDQSFHETDNFEFVAMENTNWPSANYGYFKVVSEEWCRNECLNDCFCAVAFFRNGECWKKRFPLGDGRMDPSVGGRALLKVRKQNSSFQPNDLVHKPTIVVVGSVLLGSSVFLNFFLFLLTLFIGYRLKKRKSKPVQRDPSILDVNLRIFSYEELNKATSGFIHQLGRGSFATVYKGTIDSEDNNNLVAVKKLDNLVQEGDQEFKAEESTECWCMNSCIMGLLQISFLGLRNQIDQTRTLTAIRGTKGYVAPEWFRSLPITVKVDVYSFGIIMLEIICCRRSYEKKVEDEEQMVLTDWAYDCFKDMKVEMLVENDEEAKMDLKRVKKFVMIAIWCIQEEPSLRPTMKKVLQMLEGAIEVSFPPDPCSFTSSSTII